jgi:hypothetical protein
MNKGIFRKLQKPNKTLVITGILPQLKLSCNFLSISQLDDGSWSRDILSTSSAVKALASFSNSVIKDSSLINEIKLGTEFLLRTINSMSDKIIKTEDLYSGLDKIAREFGNAIFTLWLTKSLRDDNFLQKVRSAFLKVEENVTKFIKALNDVEVVCNVLNCHMISSFPFPPEPILDFAINQLFSKDIPPKDAFLLIITLSNLEKKFSTLINEKWNFHVSRRTDKWKATPLGEALKKLMIDKTVEVVNDEKVDIATLSYCLICINRLNIEDTDLQKEVVQKLLSSFDKINVWKDEITVLDLSLFICAISESPFSNIAFFPEKESDYVINAVKWFERTKSEKIKMLKPSQYILLIAFILILIFLTTFMSYVAFSNPAITLSILTGLLSAFYFLVNRMS